MKHEHPIISNKKNKWYESNHNNTIWNIYHLPLEILCYSSLINNSSVLDEVYKITMPNIMMVPIAALFLVFWRGLKESPKETIVINGYKYQWNQSNKHNTNCVIYYLLYLVMITST